MSVRASSLACFPILYCTCRTLATQRVYRVMKVPSLVSREYDVVSAEVKSSMSSFHLQSCSCTQSV